jgi:hypothetical protein
MMDQTAHDTTPPAQPAPVQEPEIDGATMAGMDASIGHLSALVDELRLLLGCAMDNFKMLHNAAKPDDGPDMDAIIPAIVFAKFVNQDAALRYAIKHSAHDGMITTQPAQPAPVQEPVAWMHKETGLLRQANKAKGGDFEPNHWMPLYTTPPAAPVLEGRDWSLLEATQQSLREHMAEIKRLKAAQPAVPDAMTSADIQEHIEYVAGWNDCRQAMLEMMKARIKS